MIPKKISVPVAVFGASLIVAVAAGLTVNGLGVNPANAEAAADEMPSIAEDFSYPEPAKVLAEHGVKLTSGNGKIDIADCAAPPVGDIGLIEVYTTDITVNGDGAVCFRVLGVPGLLNMEVPAVFEIRGDGRRSGTGHDITATIRPEGAQATTVEVDPDGSTQVGIGTDPPGAPTTLLQLKVTG